MNLSISENIEYVYELLKLNLKPMKFIKLTRSGSDNAILRINFSNVIYYQRVEEDGYTRIMYIGDSTKNFIAVTETLEEIDALLGMTIESRNEEPNPDLSAFL